MTVFTSSQEWLRQSSLLLEARPSTTRITTRYTTKPAATFSSRKPRSQPADAAAAAADTTSTTSSSRPPRARLVLKTYDPVSGACLKYKTTKAAEVSRLVQLLGGLGRRMAALPPRDDGAAEDGADTPSGGAAGTATPTTTQGQAPAAAPAQQQQQQQQGGGGGGGKGKKKKGKR
ncbi:uncharacterized protein E0L32_009550 [Thyridium curvatum]|uniref:SRP9 domain-containing protein n=1 Tax=Thyridium curvatum TaxID=1093900 RepID=A0A507AVM3_9PEZI|nr:uncharacterized protein E0L32_009550 [Thyridium curvatum]TPX08971.1 hypothetical protein E0L32_009550 [Thyridium curvatum]